MTREERNKQIQKNRERVRDLIKEHYAKEGPNGVLARLKKEGIATAKGTLVNVASDLGVKYENDPRHEVRGKQIREAVALHYKSGGPQAVIDHLAEAGMDPLPRKGTVSNIAGEMGIKREKKVQEREFKLLDLPSPEWPSTPILKITKEEWSKPGVRVGGMSRMGCGGKGYRRGLTDRIFRIFVESGCHYNVLCGGLVDKIGINEKMAKELAKYPAGVRRHVKEQVIELILQEIVKELCSVIPRIEKPAGMDGSKLVKFHIITSNILDGKYGARVAKMLQEARPDDIRIYKPGHDKTRLRGLGATPEEKKIKRYIGWLSPTRHRLPGKYASTGVDKEIVDAEAIMKAEPTIWVYGGLGVSVGKPGGGDKRYARASLPAAHNPIMQKPGDPAVALNQIGCRVLSFKDVADIGVQTWSLADLVGNELGYIKPPKGAKLIHERIIQAVVADNDDEGLSLGTIAEDIGAERETLSREVKHLLVDNPFGKSAWPGMYVDSESGRVAFHRHPIQHHLKYPWPYGNYAELRRVLFGCLHAGYTTTDYEFVVKSLPRLIKEKNIQVVELLGDIVAGLKHSLMHRGAVISNMNYTDQEIFAAELMATVFFDVFKSRFDGLSAKKGKPSAEELAQMILASLMDFVWIVGNHDGWQTDDGHKPGHVFKSALIVTLFWHIKAWLEAKDLFAFNLLDLISSKMHNLPLDEPYYTFPDGIKTGLIHPSMARAETTSARGEQALDFFRDTHCADLANFHTAVEVEKYEAKIGQRVCIQTGTLVIGTDFENSKMKRVDFGVVVSVIRSAGGRIFFSEHSFHNQRLLKKALPKGTNPDTLKSQLGLIRCPEFMLSA